MAVRKILKLRDEEDGQQLGAGDDQEIVCYSAFSRNCSGGINKCNKEGQENESDHFCE